MQIEGLGLQSSLSVRDLKQKESESAALTLVGLGAADSLGVSASKTHVLRTNAYFSALHTLREVPLGNHCTRFCLSDSTTSSKSSASTVYQ